MDFSCNNLISLLVTNAGKGLVLDMTHLSMACLRMAFGMYMVIVPWECVPSFVLTIMPLQEKIRSLTSDNSVIILFLYLSTHKVVLFNSGQ
jgi:hypothetical protein